MSLRYKAFKITGVANTETFDAGIESTVAEPKKLVRILVALSGYAANLVQIWRENQKLAEAYDYHFNTEANDGDTSTPYSTSKLNAIELDIAIPQGTRLKVALKCAATTKNLFGCYVYDIAD